MKKLVFTAALAAACFLTGCQKELNAPEGTILTAEILQTRTALQENLKVYWSAGDQINVNGSVSKAVAEAGPSASFQFDATLTAPLKAVYPAADWKNETTLSLPAEQGASDKTFADGSAPMIAYATSGTALQFKHVAAYVRVPVKSAKTLKSVTFAGNNGEQVCGDFEIDFAAGTISTTDATEENKAVKVLVGKSEATLLIAVPANVYGNGFTLTAEDADGKQMTYIKGSATELVAGRINTLPEVVFEAVPEGEGSGTEADPYLIKTAADVAAISTKAAKESKTYFKFVDNIDMSSITDFVPANVEFSTDKQSVFIDGNHKVIRNWNWVNTTTKYPGLVGVLDGEVKDLVFMDCSIETQVSTPIGLVCGWCGVSNASLHGHVENVHAIRCRIVTNKAGNNNMGGLVGSAHNTEIINCSFDGTVERVIENTSSSYVGTGGIVGGYPTADATGTLNKIEGCTVTGSIIDKSRSTGGVIGFMRSDCVINIENCHAQADVFSTRDVVGGLTGYFGGGVVRNCSFKGNIVSEQASSSFVGGLVPHTNWKLEIYNCHTEGTITCPGDIVGGIAGQSNAAKAPAEGAHQTGPCIVKECWSTMTINSKGAAGGIIGRSSVNWPLTVENCWYSGTINATEAGNANSVGGIVGDCPKGTLIKDCWNDAAITGAYALGGVAGRMYGRQGSSDSLDTDVESSMTGCIYWGPGINTSTEGGERAANHYSSGAIIGCSSRPNTLKNNFRNPDMTLNVYAYALLNELFDHEDTDPEHPLVEPYKLGDTPVELSETLTEDFKWFSPYHGKAAAAGATISSLAKQAGWDETIWDLSGDKPMLKNTPKE